MGYLEELFGLEGKVAAITGGGGVLCGTMARALGRLGVKVAVLDISEEAARKVAEDVEAEGGEALPLKCDVTDRGSLEEAREGTLERFGRVDFLINGAGGNRPQATTSPELPFFKLPEDAVGWVFGLNFTGTFLASQVFGEHMAERREGVILNISSMNALRPLTRIPAYSAAKAAVSNFTQWLAVHMAQEYSPKIRVVAIAPGFFLTEQNRYLLLDDEGELTPRGRTIIGHTPQGRFGDPQDLIGAVVWLLSPSASFVTGIVVPVDGGFSAFSGV
ncbi:MAG TPA: SDR family oxidoreductase [Firmicutes bacterium]|nr:SDR family oxidoreductase [Bacillota bacterium]